MLTLGEKVRKIRSKNAGPFWITIDIFCGNKKIYKEVCNKLKNSEIINLLMISEQQLKSCLLYTSPSPRDKRQSRMPSSA